MAVIIAVTVIAVIAGKSKVFEAGRDGMSVGLCISFWGSWLKHSMLKKYENL